jgi:hypothetical protein
VTRPRAADDFPVIRARMEELWREQAEMPNQKDVGPAIGPRPYAIATRPGSANRSGPLPTLRRAFGSARSA